MFFEYIYRYFYVQPNLLIYGANGWIGGMYVDYIKNNHKNIKIKIGKSRVDDIKSLEEELVLLKPTHVISFIGRTHGIVENQKINSIDYLEYPGKLVENIQDNLYAPVILAQLCVEYNIHYTYIGTGCIFNTDDERDNFVESDEPNYFGSSYSIVKGFTDRIMQTYGSNVLNLRIRMPISSIPNERNFITKITKYSKICSMDNSMTVLDDFFPIFTKLLENNSTGTYNCVNPGTINHNEILYKYQTIVKPEFTWKNMSIFEQSKLLRCDRSNNLLNTHKIRMEFPDLPNIDKSIDMVLNRMKLLTVEL